MRTVESATLISSTLIGAMLFGLALYSFYIDYVTLKPWLNLFIDTILIIFSAIIIGGSLNIKKKLYGYEIAVNKTFNNVVYSRLKPIMEEVALGIIEINSLRKKLEEMENKLSVLEDLATTQKLSPEEKINFYFKTIIVMLFYLGTFVFMTQYSLPNIHLVAILLFIYWWGFITYEYKLFDKSEALVMLGAPVLIVPSLYLLLRVLVGMVFTQALMFVASGFYAWYYYLIAREITSGKRAEILEKIKSSILKQRK